MSSNVRKAIFIVVAVLVGGWAISAVLSATIGLLAGLVGLAFKVAIVAGILYVGYRLFGPKALGGGSRRTLP